MKQTRRDVLCTAAALGAALVTPTSAVAQSLSRRTRPRPGPAPAFVFTRDGFTRHVQQVFRVYRPGRSMYGLGLIAVTDGAAATAAGTVGSQHCFTAVFVGPANDPLPEATYDMATPEWAAMQVFLKRAVVLDGYQYYEAAFNLLPPA